MKTPTTARCNICRKKLEKGSKTSGIEISYYTYTGVVYQSNNLSREFQSICEDCTKKITRYITVGLSEELNKKEKSDDLLQLFDFSNTDSEGV